MINSFHCWDKDKNEFQQTIKIAHDVIDDLSKQVEVYQKKADENTGKIMPVESVSRLFGNRYSSIDSYRKDNSWYIKEPYQTVAQRAKDWAEQTYKTAKEIHDRNIPAIENNIKVYKQVKLLMQNVGIPLVRYETDYKSRKRYKPSISLNAGFIDDLNRNCITSDGWSSVESDYKRMLEDIEKYIETNKTKEYEEERKKADELKKKESDILKATLVVKYNLEYTSNWSDILGEILSKNKYLRLSHFLEKNRNDWSDGYDYAATGLESFKIETDTDQSIYDDIQSYIDNWDGDGRIFRDCEWNYDVLYSMVKDESLMKDYLIVKNNIGD